MFAEEAATKSPLLIAFRNPTGDLLIRIKISINADMQNGHSQSLRAIEAGECLSAVKRTFVIRFAQLKRGNAYLRS